VKQKLKETFLSQNKWEKQLVVQLSGKAWPTTHKAMGSIPRTAGKKIKEYINEVAYDFKQEKPLFQLHNEGWQWDMHQEEQSGLPPPLECSSLTSGVMSCFPSPTLGSTSPLWMEPAS
jgi:hypothetical protein